MRRYPVTVLKFGSSVLACEADLSKAVQEIYRWTVVGTAWLRSFRRLDRLLIPCWRGRRLMASV